MHVPYKLTRQSFPCTAPLLMWTQSQKCYLTSIWELCKMAQLPKLFVQRRDFHIKKRACKKDRFTIPSLEEHWIVSCTSMPAQLIQVRTCCNTEPYKQQYVLFSHEKSSEVLISFLSLFTLYLQLLAFLLAIPHEQEQMYKSEKIYFSFQRNQGQPHPKRNCEGPITGPQGSEQAL